MQVPSDILSRRPLLYIGFGTSSPQPHPSNTWGKSKLSNDYQFTLLQNSEPLNLKECKTVLSAFCLFHAFWFLMTYYFTFYFRVKFIFLYFFLKWNSKLLETKGMIDLFCRSHNTQDLAEIIINSMFQMWKLRVREWIEFVSISTLCPRDFWLYCLVSVSLSVKWKY